MSRRSSQQRQISDEEIYRVWASQGSYAKAAAILGCSAQHVSNVRRRHERAKPLMGLFLRGCHYVEPEPNNEPQYPCFELVWRLDREERLLIDIIYSIAAAMQVIQALLCFRAPVLALMLHPAMMGLWLLAGSGGRKLRAYNEEQAILLAWRDGLLPGSEAQGIYVPQFARV